MVGETEERLYFLLIYILKRVDARSGEFLSRIFSVYHEPAHSHHTGRLRRLGRGYSDFTMRQLGFPGVQIHGPPRPFNFLTCPAAVPLTHRTPVGCFPTAHISMTTGYLPRPSLSLSSQNQKGLPRLWGRYRLDAEGGRRTPLRRDRRFIVFRSISHRTGGLTRSASALGLENHGIF